MFIIKHKKIFLTISAVLVGLALTVIAIFGLKAGIDFKGGSMTEVVYRDGRPTQEEVQKAVGNIALGNAIVQPTGENGYIIKTRDLSDTERQNLIKTLEIGGVNVDEKSYTSIGPSVGRELTRKAIMSIILVALAIILFIAYAFRHVSEPVSSWKYGLIAVITLLHDIIIPTGIFAIMGKYFGAEIDTLFVVALLTILGLSVSDTIVVFDRIRENLRKESFGSFAEAVGASLKQTFTRSINTSLTVILALLALLFFGPETTRNFALVLTVGMFLGTYSSIFIASPLLVLAEEMQDRKSRRKNK